MMELTTVNSEMQQIIITDKAKEYIAQSKASNTVKSYRADWKDFTNYCNTVGCQSLPANEVTIVNYIAVLADNHKASTIQRKVSAISQAHKAAGFDTPTQTFAVKAIMAGIRRNKGTMADKKQAAVIDDIRMMVNTLDDRLISIRDRALLLIGFAGAFRRSELAGLTMDNIEFNRNGVTITLVHSKTDQEGAGYKKGIPYGSNPATCPVRALQDWLEAANITEGAIFRSMNRHGQVQDSAMSDKAVALIVKRTAEAAGLDSSKYSGHSLRSGFITTAAANGTNERNIMKQSGHKSIAVMRGYIHDATLYNDNAAANVGL
jgi:site-specific recombinase XerD